MYYHGVKRGIPSISLLVRVRMRVLRGLLPTWLFPENRILRTTSSPVASSVCSVCCASTGSHNMIRQSRITVTDQKYRSTVRGGSKNEKRLHVTCRRGVRKRSIDDKR